MYPNEPEIVMARMAFADAQAALSGPSRPLDPEVGSRVTTHRLQWYGTVISDERGSFCIVREDGPYEDLVGDILRFIYGTREIYAYCVGMSSAIAYDFAVTRRLFAHLEFLPMKEISAVVEVVA